MIRNGCDLTIILDSAAQADAVASASRRAQVPVPVLIEIDSDQHRGGLRPDDPELITVGKILHEGGAELRGVLAHAGESYGAAGREAQAIFAERERAATVAAAESLREAGLPCPVVCNVHGNVLDELIVIQANQEHGVIACRPGRRARMPDLPVGTQLRILPNHACATAAQHAGYNVLPVGAGESLLEWPRLNGW